MGVKKSKSDKRTIVGVGSALVDILTNENYDFLLKAGVKKGGMTLVDDKTIDYILAQTSDKPSVVPGGSACNTIIGIGRLGGNARFIGKRGLDELGRSFEDDLRNNNVEPVLFTSSSPTGRVLSIITPDAERSMLTHLGASSETKPGEINRECFRNAAIVHIEGYLLFNEEIMMAVLNAAKEAGSIVSLDLASFTIVEQSKEILEDIIYNFVDIVMANEDEARSFTGCCDEMKAIEALSEQAEIAVLKVGKDGSYIANGGKVIKIEPMGDGSAVDTTGAGDLWASGFLFGLLNNFPLEKCGKLGSACGYEVCQVIGANIPDHGWLRISEILEE